MPSATAPKLDYKDIRALRGRLIRTIRKITVSMNEVYASTEHHSPNLVETGRSAHAEIVRQLAVLDSLLLQLSDQQYMYDATLRGDTRFRMDDLLEALPSQEAISISNTAIAKVLGVSQQRVSQIRTEDAESSGFRTRKRAERNELVDPLDYVTAHTVIDPSQKSLHNSFISLMAEQLRTGDRMTRKQIAIRFDLSVSQINSLASQYKLPHREDDHELKPND